MGLTPSQLDAVAVENPPRDTCVVAGPGSGKTTVLVEYFNRLVESGVDPLRILAITFTDKAANNMRDKLARAFHDRPEIRGKLERAYVSTVHGFCARLLKENAVFAGLDPDFFVMDERESLRERRRAIDEALDAMFAEQPDRMRALMRGLASIDAGAEVLDAYDAIRAAGVRVADLAHFAAPPAVGIAAALAEVRSLRPAGWKFDQEAHLQEAQSWVAGIAAAIPHGPEATLRAMRSFTCKLAKLKRGTRPYELLKSLKDDLLPELEYSLVGEYYATERNTILELFARFDNLYRQAKQRASGLDYDDLEEYAVRLLEENPDVRRRLQNQFDQVLMDEFQDTNGCQAKLLELLRPPNRFYAVGDINQSIYGFRHADPSVFSGYRDTVKQQGQRLVELVENFRSRSDILQAVETVTGGLDGIERRPLIPGLAFEHKTDPSVEAVSAETLDLEARWVAARILALQGTLQLRRGTAEFRDFALLVRNSEVLPEFTQAFDHSGIPYLVNRGKGFYETREVVDLIHLLRILSNPRDEISMAAVLRSPFVALSDEALLRLSLEQGASSAPPALPGDDDEKLARFREQLSRWRAIRDYTSIDQLLQRALDESGYECPTGPRGAANVEKFLAQARAAGARQTLAEFAAEIEILRESKPREPDAPPEDSANAVKIMTVHAAKGLEFPVVFLAALHKGIDASPGAISFLPGVGLGARWHHPLCRDDKDDAFEHAIRQQLKQREKEESHRLLYVAMTRAEEHLALSFSTTGKKAQNWAAIVDQTLDVRPIAALPGALVSRTLHEAPPPQQLIPPPTIAERHDSQANVTSIALFADCPRRYYLSRYLGLEFPPPPVETAAAPSSLNAGQFGAQVHALLAGVPLAAPDPEAAKLAAVFPKTPLGLRASEAATVEREFDFLMEVEGLVLRGQIDLWFEDRGKTALVDYKTDRVTVAEVSARAGRYALQLRLYALALERLTGRMPQEAYLYFLRPNIAIPIDLRPSLFDDAPETIVREFREAQDRQHFPLREGTHCRACPHFMRLCPARLTAELPVSPNPA